jgi:hypothetical protein
MVNTGTQGGSSSGSSIPFTKSGRVPAPLHTVDNRQETSVMESWTTNLDDPRTAYTFQPRQAVRSLSQRKSDLEQVAEIDSGELPAEYFARISTMPMFSVTQSPIDMPTGDQWRSPNHRGSSSSRRRPSFGIATPTTPSSVALTTGTTFASDMSRQSSFCNDAILGSFEMMNVHSNTSIFTDSNSTDERSYQSSMPFTTSTYPKLLSSEEQSQLLAGTGGAGEDSQFASLPSFMGDMKRSGSHESNSSSMSATSRATTQLKRQNQLASRPLAPALKAGGDEVAMSREGSHIIVSMKSQDGSEARAVTAIAKTPYQRPKHERVSCAFCTECPEGFRGQHELGRHHDRQHKEIVKKWVCVDPADGVINPIFRPVNPLSKCKACSTLKKKYGAYYNAAAHLRRAHFKPKPRGRGKSAKVEEKSEKRGGKGGGDWPPMIELKRWMKEVYENVSESQQQDADEEEEDVDDDDCSGSFEIDDNYTKLQDMSNISSANSDFDNTYLYGDTPMPDAYPAPTSNFNTQSMQNMPYDNLAITQSIDLSMRIDSSQSSFAESQFASMNDPMAFIESFPQIFADQTLGPDSYHNFQYHV